MTNRFKQTISADSLFHFTNSFEVLISILTHDFHPRYSLEDFKAFATPNQNAYYSESYINGYEKAVPMTCFCDIPLSKISNHVLTYGGVWNRSKKRMGDKKKAQPCYVY